MARKVWAVAGLAALGGGRSAGEAQAPIRVGASLAQTGVYAASGQNQLRGYQRCVKHVNDKGRGAGAEA